MRKSFYLLIFVLFVSSNGFTQSLEPLDQSINKNDSVDIDGNTSGKEQFAGDSPTQSAGPAEDQPDFNKKRLSLDRFDDRKWYALIGYSFFHGQGKYPKLFSYRLGINGGYRFTKNFSAEVFVLYADGKTSANGNTVRSTMYDIGALGIAEYPFELNVGSISPYAAFGASYSFGNVRDTSKYNISGGGMRIKAGVRYTYNLLIAGVFAGYFYNLSQSGPVKDFSGIEYGLEAGLKF